MQLEKHFLKQTQLLSQCCFQWLCFPFWWAATDTHTPCILYKNTVWYEHAGGTSWGRCCSDTTRGNQCLWKSTRITFRPIQCDTQQKHTEEPIRNAGISEWGNEWFAEVLFGVIRATEDIYADEQKQELFELQCQTDFMASRLIMLACMWNTQGKPVVPPRRFSGFSPANISVCSSE